MRKATFPQDILLLRKLAQDVESILDEIQNLHNSVWMFRKFRDLRNRNPRLLVHSPFIEWLIENYVHSTAVGIRKQLKAGGVSLRSVLDTLEANPGLVSRKQFLDFFAGHPLTEAAGEEQFDRFAGVGARLLSPDALRQDKLTLLSRCRKVEYLVDKRIAHYDRVDVLPVPTFADLEDAVEVLKEISRKYSVLLRGADRGFEFSYLDEWSSVLRFPWLQ